MNIHQHHLLASDVVFVTRDGLSAEDTQHVALATTDVVVTYNNSRKRSKVVNKELADLLQTFASPLTVAEAIYQHAVRTQQDPQQLADVIFPALLTMQQEGYLLPENKPDGPLQKSRLIPGDSFRNYVVKEVCQSYENSTVYKAEDANGIEYAVKMFHSPAQAMPPVDYTNEVSVLQKLDNAINPSLVEHGQYDSAFYLVTNWCEGATCEAKAGQFRNLISLQNVLVLLDTCIAITTAYQHLHEQEVLHGDVHPANVLIDENGKVTIIDYGEAVTSGGRQRAVRGGIDYYYEPELATALLHNKKAVPITEKSEQYALAVLLYRLITGHQYLQFSYEPEKAYHQIAEEPPLPFASFDITLPAEVEMVFRKALAKDPAHRYLSLAHLTDALRQGRLAVEESRLFFIGGKQQTGENFVNFLVNKYGPTKTLIQTGLQRPPTCSVNNGAAGIAYFLYRAACVFEEPSWLDAADVWSNYALAYRDDYTTAFFAANEGITETTVGKRSLYHSPTGVHMVQAMISNCRGDGHSLQTAIQQYLLAAGAACNQLDLTLGKAGLLIGGALLLNESKTITGSSAGAVTSFTNNLLQELWQQIDTYPSLEAENEIGYFGIAHGWGGILYGTLLWCATSGQPLPGQFTGRLEELLAMALLRNGALHWPVSNDNTNEWLGWCHGNAGYVFLWSLAFTYFRDERFRTAAVQTGAALFDSRPQTTNLCCGLAGEAYALLKLYQLTGEEKYNQQVAHIKHRILRNLASQDLRNHSLYKGEVGIGVLLCELTRPEMARLPLFS